MARARVRARRGDADTRSGSTGADLERLLERLNPPTLARAFGHKVILNRHLAALGLPVPRLHGVIGRAGGWNAAAGRPVTGPEVAGRFLAGLDGDVVVRPDPATPGAGALVLRRDGNAFVDGGGRRREPSQVAAEAHADPRAELFVVQALVEPDPGLRALAPVGGLPPLRITTFVPDDGQPQVVHACVLRPGVGDGSDRAAARAPVAEVDLAMGAPEGGDRLPDWEAACDLARRAAGLLKPQRSVAWDIGLTADGPVVLGADSRYERIEVARFDEAVRAMERALTDGGPAVIGGAA